MKITFNERLLTSQESHYSFDKTLKRISTKHSFSTQLLDRKLKQIPIIPIGKFFTGIRLK